jgi:hypothetical protein
MLLFSLINVKPLNLPLGAYRKDFAAGLEVALFV